MYVKKIYGLIGYPVKHSLSPAMHNAAFGALKINAEYKLFPLKAGELEGFLRCLKENHIFGLNVTIPYKEEVMPFLSRLSKEAKLIGAVNTIKRAGNKLTGFNTDGEGFFRHITQDLGFNPKGKIIAVMGAGGAAKAVSVYLSQAKPKIISIYDVNKAKLLTLFHHLRANFKDAHIEAVNSIEELNIKNCDLLVNATPVGMKDSDPCLVNAEFIHKGLLVYDLIYNPAQTKLLKLAREKGCRASNGLGMLLYQGAAAFELWTNKRAPVEIMRKTLSHLTGVETTPDRCGGK